MAYVQAIMRSEILDDRTCDVCEELDGVVLPADHPLWAREMGLPAHPNCRYMLVPIIEGIDPVLKPTDPDEVIRLTDLFPFREDWYTTMYIPLTPRTTILPLRVEDLREAISPFDVIDPIFGLVD